MADNLHDRVKACSLTALKRIEIVTKNFLKRGKISPKIRRFFQKIMNCFGAFETNKF